MKKFYFSLVAAMMLSASATVSAQDGKTCETALPYTGFLMGSSIKETTWYTVTVSELSMFPSSVIDANTADLKIYEGCDGREAASNGTGAYFLYPGVEYKMKIVPGETIFLLMLTGNGLSLAKAPEGMYCVKPIILTPDAETGAYPAVKQNLGTTKWYQRDFSINGNLTVTEYGFGAADPNLKKIELKRGDCGAVSSIGETMEIVPGMTVAPSPFAKAGTNLMAVTFGTSDDPEVTEGQFHIAQNGQTSLDCNNRPERMTEIALDTETGIINGYTVKDYVFKPTETGEYTFTCKSAEGTIFNVGTVYDTGEKRNPGTEYEAAIYACSYDISDPVIVNSTNQAYIVLNLEAGNSYVMHYDADYTLEAGTPSVKVEKGNTTSINAVEANKKTDVIVSENPTDGNFTVSSYLLADGGEIALYDMAAKKVFGTKVQEGAKEQNVQLTNVKQGTYLLVVYGRGRSAATKLIVK